MIKIEYNKYQCRDLRFFDLELYLYYIIILYACIINYQIINIYLLFICIISN